MSQVRSDRSDMTETMQQEHSGDEDLDGFVGHVFLL